METNQINVFDNNKKMLTEHVKVHPGDIAIIDDTINKLIELEAGRFVSVVVEETGMWGWALLLTNDKDGVFYLKLSEYGSIELLRKDGPQGEVISYEMYDDPEGFDLPEEDIVD